MDMQVKGESLLIEIAGAEVKLQPAVIAELWIERITKPAAARLDELRTTRCPIGEKGLYGIYAGIARGYDDEDDGIIEVLEAIPPKHLNHADALAWAESVGGTLPTRKEAALLFANVPELFDSNYAYWTRELFAGNESYAWYQGFDNGTQYDYHEGGELRARAVRRLSLQ